MKPPPPPASQVWPEKLGGSRLAMSHGHLEIPGTQGTREELGGVLFTKWFWGSREPLKLAGCVVLCLKRQKEAGGLFPTIFKMGVLPGSIPGTGLGGATVPVKRTYLGAPWGRWAAVGDYFNALTRFL